MKFCLILLVAFCTCISYALPKGQGQIDLLLKLLPKAKEDTAKVTLLDRLSIAYGSINPDKGIEFGSQGLDLANQLKWPVGVANSNCALAVNYSKLRNLPKAIDFYNTALKIFQQTGDSSKEFTINNDLSLLYQDISDYPKAISILLRNLPGTKEDTNKLNLLDNLSFVYTTVNPDEGIKYGRQELELADKLGRKYEMASAYSQIGLNYRAKSDYQKALDYFGKALKLYQELGETSKISVNISNISVVYQMQGDYKMALEYNFKSLKIDESLGYQNCIAGDLGNIGSVYQSLADYNKALEYDFKSMKIFDSLGDKGGVANNLGNIGNVYQAQNFLPAALDNDFKALKIFRELGDKTGIANTLCSIAGIYNTQKNYHKSLEFNIEAMKISHDQGDRGGEAICLGNLGGTYLAIAKDNAGKIKADSLIPAGKKACLAKASDCLERALKVCQELSIQQSIIDLSSGLAEVYALSGRYKDALEVYRKYTDLKDSIFSTNNKLLVSNFESQRDLDQRNKDIELKDKQLRIDKLVEAKDRNRYGLMVVSIALLLVIIGIIAKTSNNHKKASRRLAIEKKKHLERIAAQSKVLADIANIQSHDVRGQVTTIMGLVQLFNFEDTTDPTNSVIIHGIAEVTEKLDTIIKDLVIKENTLSRSTREDNYI